MASRRKALTGLILDVNKVHTINAEEGSCADRFFISLGRSAIRHLESTEVKPLKNRP